MDRDIREKFEAWYLNLHGSTNDDLITATYDDPPLIKKGEYLDLSIYTMWQAWKARQDEIDALKAVAEKLEDRWEYYQDLVKANGFDSITGLLVEAGRMKVRIAELEAAQEDE